MYLARITKHGVYRRQPLHPVLNFIPVFRLRKTCVSRSPLDPLKQIPRVRLVRHVRKLVAPAVGDDHVAAGLEGLQVVGHLGAEELLRVQRGLLDHHGHALGLHALHDALDGARARGHRSRAPLSGSISPAAKSLRMGLASTMASILLCGTYL